VKGRTVLTASVVPAGDQRLPSPTVERTKGAIVTRKSSVWTRVKLFIRPERETYNTRHPRVGEPAPGLETQKYEATDSRRHGGTGAIGGH
jgi:hypothetical protein